MSNLDPTITERFGGVARLYGLQALEAFVAGHVAVVGVGGVGSWAAEALARSGVGKITLIDLDDICVTNVNRQLHAMDGAIGQQKTQAMAERIQAINPLCEVVCEEAFYSKRNSEELLSRGYDVVIDAIDAALEKFHLLAECRDRNIRAICCGGIGGRKDPSKLVITDLSKSHNDGLLHMVRRDLRSHRGFPAGGKKAKKFGIECIYSTERPVYPTCDGETSLEKQSPENMKLNCASGFGSITHMTATVGMLAAERALHYLSNPN